MNRFLSSLLLVALVCGGCAEQENDAWQASYEPPWAAATQCWAHVPAERVHVVVKSDCKPGEDGRLRFLGKTERGVEWIVGLQSGPWVYVCEDYTRYGVDGIDLLRHEMSHYVCEDKLGDYGPRCRNYTGECWL